MDERKKEILRSGGLTEEQIEYVDQAHKIQIIKLVIVAVIFLISFGMLALCGFTNIIPKEYYYVIAVSSIFISFLSMFYLVYYLGLKIKMGFI